MKILITSLLGCVLATTAFALDSAGRITPQIQSAIDAQQRIVAGWAANPVIFSTVKAQNKAGPLPGMTNAKWHSLKPDDPIVQSLRKNPASLWLTKKLVAGNGLYREAFLNAAQGEKAAFVEKPTSYLHNKSEKFTTPMNGRPWQGKPEFDKSSHSYIVQIATPVLDREKPIGVLVVGLSMKAMKDASR